MKVLYGGMWCTVRKVEMINGVNWYEIYDDPDEPFETDWVPQTEIIKFKFNNNSEAIKLNI